MALRNLKETDDDQKKHMLEGFINAPRDQNFGHEVVAMYLGCSPWTLARMRCDGSDALYKNWASRCIQEK